MSGTCDSQSQMSFHVDAKWHSEGPPSPGERHPASYEASAVASVRWVMLNQLPELSRKVASMP